MEAFTMKFTEEIGNTCFILEENRQEWEKRYKGYLDKINKAENFPKNFNLPSVLRCYKSISICDKFGYDLRYAGRSVGGVLFDNGNLKLNVKDENEEGRRKFNIPVIAGTYEWDSKEAQAFRSHFKNYNKNNPEQKTPERCIEELLLNEMSQQSTELRDISPVKLLNAYFQMPTPLGASGNELKYSGFRGGGIDILARIGKGKGTKLCVIELKDENKETEPQPKVMVQALRYATFIAYLLRSEVGTGWWNLFGFSGSIPKSLNVHVLTLMPESGSKEEAIINDVDFKVPGLDDVTLQCHAMNFKLEDNKFYFSSDSAFCSKIIRDKK